MANKDDAVDKLAELAEDEGKSKIIVIPTPMPSGAGRITRSVKLFGEVCDEQSESFHFT